MKITIAPEDLERFEDFKESIIGDPLYGHTDGLTRVEIVLLAKLLENEFPNELSKPLTVTIAW
jgi:hypothetical protein